MPSTRVLSNLYEKVFMQRKTKREHMKTTAKSEKPHLVWVYETLCLRLQEGLEALEIDRHHVPHREREERRAASFRYDECMSTSPLSIHYFS